MKKEELIGQMKNINWFHRIELGDGVVTPGPADPRWLFKNLGMPADLSGKTVLDIGAWDGFFSFEAEKRKAARVLATDWFCWGGPGWGTQAGFNLARKALNSKVEDLEIDIPDLTAERVGQFDIVLFLGVLYHVRNPIAILERVYDVTRERLILETQVDFLFVNRPVLAFYPGAEQGGDPTNWFGPNPSAVVEMLKIVGFKRVEVVLKQRPLPNRIYRSLRNPERNTQPFNIRLQQARMVFHAWK